MLRSLRIENFALIRSAEVEFGAGLTAFTGETGSGKSMLLGALSFACGMRNDSENIARPNERTLVTLRLDADPELLAWLAERGYEIDEDEEIALEREISRGGKSAARICGRSASLATLRELGREIVDIVGQHEAQRLTAASFQRTLLDRFGGAPSLDAMAAVADAYRALEEARDRYAALEIARRTQREREAFLRDALAALDALRPQPEEYSAMRERRSLLAHGERIAGALRAAHEALRGEEASADRAIGSADAALRSVAALVPEIAGLASRVEALQGELVDVAIELDRSLERLERAPGELEALESRAAEFERIARLYGNGDPDALAARWEELREASELLDSGEERLAVARECERAAAEALAAADGRLCAARREAAKRLSASVEGEFAELSLGGARFGVTFEARGEIGAQGSERTIFTFSANSGEPERALAKIASGGERSRVLLALVLALAAVRRGASYVFDEVDAGIGGAVAAAVGERLARLASDAQVICVTHLAQIAVHARAQIVLEKVAIGDTTAIALCPVDAPSERENEIARMLSGEPHRQALEHAREMIARAAELREFGGSSGRSFRPRRPASRS
uniref:DNA repair protein RecN n=1 Tax=mine drainage metagenome TaxID=410659 RepID=E6Q4K7_9ZZZZ